MSRRAVDRIFQAKQPCQHPFDIAVHHGPGLTKSDAHDGIGNIIADPRQGAERIAFGWKASAVFTGDHAGGFHQMVGPAVIAQAFPKL